MSNTSTPEPKPPAAPAAPVVRESDGRHQLVGYLGWKAILERLARRRP